MFAIMASMSQSKKHSKAMIQQQQISAKEMKKVLYRNKQSLEMQLKDIHTSQHQSFTAFTINKIFTALKPCAH